MQTAADYKQKKPEALSLQSNREKKIRQREEEVQEAATNFDGLIPISVLMMNQKQGQNNNDNNDDDKNAASFQTTTAADEDDH